MGFFQELMGSWSGRKRRPAAQEGSAAADSSPAKRSKGPPAAQAPSRSHHELPPPVVDVQQQQQQQQDASFQRTLQEVAQQEVPPKPMQLFSTRLFNVAGAAGSPAANARAGAFGDVNPALPQIKQFTHRHQQQQPRSSFSPAAYQSTHSLLRPSAPWQQAAQQQRMPWQDSGFGRGSSRAATLGLQAAAATPDSIKQRLDFAGGAAAGSLASPAAAAAGGRRMVAAVRSRLHGRSASPPAAAVASPQAAVRTAVAPAGGPDSNLGLAGAGNLAGQQQQPLPAWLFAGLSPAANFSEALQATAGVFGAHIRRAAVPSPLAGGVAAVSRGAAAAADPDAGLLREVEEAQQRFESHLQREQKLVSEVVSPLYQGNQRCLLDFSADYQANASSQTAIAMRRQAAELQQRRHEDQQKLLLQQHQRRVSVRSSLAQLAQQQQQHEQQRRQQQLPQWLQQAPRMQQEQQPAAAAAPAAPPKQQPAQQQQQEEEEDDDVVLISDSDDDEQQQPQQQQQEDELFGVLAEEGQQPLGYGSEPQSEEEAEQQESEASDEEESEEAAEAAAGIAGLELSWMGRPGNWAPTQAQAAAFEAALHSGAMSRVVTSQGRAHIDLTRELLQCMLPGAWLNDEVMNFYVALMQDRDTLLRGSPGVPSCHFFNTFFINKLYRDARAYNYGNVRKWTLPKRLVAAGQASDCVLKCDRVIVPVHEGAHWTAACVDLAGRRLLYFDSLKGRNTAVMAALRRWVADEARDKLSAEWDVASWPELYPDAIPAQTNTYDCGVFALLFANRLGLGRPFDFRQPDLTHNARVRVTCELLGCKLQPPPQ